VGFFLNLLYTVLIKEHTVKTWGPAASNICVLHENMLVQGTENIQKGQIIAKQELRAVSEQENNSKH